MQPKSKDHLVYLYFTTNYHKISISSNKNKFLIDKIFHDFRMSLGTSIFKETTVYMFM